MRLEPMRRGSRLSIRFHCEMKSERALSQRDLFLSLLSAWATLGACIHCAHIEFEGNEVLLEERSMKLS